MVWIEDQTSHNTPLIQSLIQNKALTLFKSMKDEKSNEAEERFEVHRGWFMSFKERKETVSIISRYEMKQQVLMWKLQDI